MRWSLRKRVRPIQQMEAAECGIACLTMVLGHHGQHVPLAELREQCGTSRDGNSALDLLRGGRARGLEGRGLSVSLAALRTLRKPAILHWDMNHFVVLEWASRTAIGIVDPASGRRRVPLADVDRSFSGVALEFLPGPSFVRRKPRAASLERYWAALRKARGPLAFVLVANALGQLLALVLPAANQVMIDHVVLPGRPQWFVPILAAMGLGALGQVTLGKLQGRSLATLQGLLGLELTLELGRGIARLPLPFVDSRSHGDLLERVHAQTGLQSLLAASAQAVFDAFSLLLFASLMLAYDLRLGALSLGLLVLRFALLRLVRGVGEQSAAAELAARGREQGVLVEATRCPELIKGLGAEARLVERYRRRVVERAGLSIRAARIQKATESWLRWFGSLLEASVLWYGGTRVVGGAMSLGVFSGFLALRQLVEVPAGALTQLFDQWVRFRAVLDRSQDVLSVQAEPRGTVLADAVVGRIEVRNLGFRYGTGGRWVFRNVDFVVEPGEKLVIVGPSGHGKSTLGKLLVGLLQPSEGEVLLDGVPILQYAPESLAQQLGVVLQEPLILEGSVAEVIRLRKPAALHTQVVAAARAACLHDMIRALPNGYDSRVAPLGANLSGGERQRLALAQALLADPRVLLLDEATCALDPATEAQVLSNLDARSATLISIAHRDSVVARARRLLRVSDGAVTALALGGSVSTRPGAATEVRTQVPSLVSMVGNP